MGKGGFLIFVLVAGTVQCAKESLEIIPSNGDVQLGKQEYFLCKVKSGGEAALTWTDPEDEEITEDTEPYNEKRIDELSKGLEITLSDPKEGGIFTCKGEFDSGKTAEAQIKIRAIQKPTFVTPIDPLKEVNEGTRVEINCQAKGIPLPTIRWLFGNQDASSIGDGRVFVENGRLVIEKIQLSDAGVYYCVASIEERNEVDFSNITLRIKFSPRIEFPAGESFVTQIGKPSQYNFTILANPVPSVSVTWKEKVFEGDDVKNVAQDGDRYFFSFEFTPTSQEDISELLITATNDLGSTEKKLTLQEDSPGLETGSIVAIVLIVLLVIFLVVDVSCYYKRRRGLLMYCRTNILGKNSPGMGAENSGKVASKSGKSSVVNVSGIEA